MKFKFSPCNCGVRLSVFCLVLIAGLIIISGLLLLSLDAYKDKDSQTNDQETITNVEQIDELAGHYLLTGTIVWDRNVETWSRVSGQIDPQQPFSGLYTYQPENYDAWVADLECPTSAQDLPAEAGGDHRLEFNCRQEYLEPARKYFEFFNLANNHSDNSGRDKLEETRQALSQAQFQHFGDPDPSYTDNACEVVGLPIRLLSKSETEPVTTGRLPVAFCAWHYFYRKPLPGEIELMKEYAKIMPVFSFVHMGQEYAAAADGVQRQIAHAVIDAGAEFVVGNNPHWVQDAEVYNGKLIIYSTGNFIFDQQFNEEVKRSVSLDVSISVPYSQEVQEWLDLGAECIAYKDDCLGKATSLGLTKLDLHFDYDVVAGDLTGQLQTRANQTIQAWVEARLGWSKVLH